jgi:hypothetical protein
MISYKKYLEAGFEYYQSCELDKKRKRKKTSLGDQRLQKLRQLLDSMGLERSDMQKNFHEQFLAACANKIYGDDVNPNMHAIAKREGWTDLKQQVVCSTPRRFGKTTAVAMFAVNKKTYVVVCVLFYS